MTSQIKIHDHLFQIYPSMPQYAADPSQSDIIRVYDHIMLRFSGHYGCRPSYFIKSPLCPVLFGDSHSYINLPTISFCSSQNVIIAIGKNETKKIRLNHFQTTLFGELQLKTNIEQWKFNQTVFEDSQLNMGHNQQKLKNQQYNVVMKILKTFAQINNLKQLPGLDILVYKDFIEEQFMYSREAFIYGLYSAIHVTLIPKISLQQKTLHKVFQKITDSSTSHVVSLPQLFHSKYDQLAYIPSNEGQKSQSISFPEGYGLIIANSMTPLPQKLTKGKRFNLRQCEIQIGIELILQYQGITKQVRSIKQLMQTTQCNLKQMFDTIEAVIPQKGMSTQKIESILERPLIQVLKHIPYANNVLDENLQFYPYNRFKFFLSQQVLIQQLIQKQNEKSLNELIDESSKNAKNLLQISSQQIEQIQKIASEFQCQTKILGNGWGGCVLIMCKQSLLQNLEKDLIQKFYLSQNNRILLGDDIDVYIRFVGKPQTGLSILDPQNQIWYG